jgi:hypothetical protein
MRTGDNMSKQLTNDEIQAFNKKQKEKAVIKKPKKEAKEKVL